MGHICLPVNNSWAISSPAQDHTDWGREGPALGVRFPRFLYSPAEDSLKDGHQLKQLLLKALTLMLDAAESYAKVTTGSFSRLALGLSVCSRNYFAPGLFQVNGEEVMDQLGAEGVSSVARGFTGEMITSLYRCLPPHLSLRTPACDRPFTVTSSPSC